MSGPSPSADADARYARIAAERAANGDRRRPLNREESLALVSELFGGPVPDDPEAVAWAERAFGVTGTA